MHPSSLTNRIKNTDPSDKNKNSTKRAGGVNGREVQLAEESWFTPERVDMLKKIAALSAIALIVCGAMVVPFLLQGSPNASENPSCQEGSGVGCSSSISPVPPHYLNPYIAKLNFSAVPLSAHPITEFPAYFPKVVIPGYMSGKNNDLCAIPKIKMPSFSDCETIANEVHQIIQENYPELYAKEIAAKPLTTLERGFAFDLAEQSDDYSIRRIALGVDSRKIENYIKAIDYVQENVLKVPSFFEGDSETVLHAILKTHQHLTVGIIDNSGEFRTGDAIVFEGKFKDGRRETPEETLKRRGGTKQDFENWKSIKKKSRQMGGLEEALDSLTKREIKTLNKIGFLPSRVKEIKREMVELSERIQEMALKVIHGELEAVAAAAFVHQEIGRIHPFEDGNGRLARIWTNVMLQLGGIKAVIFPDQEKYIEAVIEDQKSPGAFAHYLEEVIEWNSQQDVLQ